MFRSEHFRGDQEERGMLAYELDNVFHYRREEIDNIIIIDAKAQPVELLSDGRWNVTHKNRLTGKLEGKDVKRQLRNQAETVLRYLRPLAANVELQIEAWAVSSAATQEMAHLDEGSIRLGVVSYCGIDAVLSSFLSQENNLEPEILRVSQSQFLSLLRLGIAVPALGHPEPRHAIQYVDRCKRELDFQLYKSFAPSKRRWVVNGTAGMGKSILLAYSIAALASGKKVTVTGGSVKLEDWDADSAGKGLVSLGERAINVYAMKPKQLLVLEESYNRFVGEFSRIAGGSDLPFLKPYFSVWNDSKEIPHGCNIVILDESHDLSATGQAIIKEWHERDEMNYLLLACDHHQKVEGYGSDAVILKGVSFSGRSKRLNKNYRNPFPVFATALSLLCRWFGEEGPQIRPTQNQLKDLLGFDIKTDDRNPDTTSLSMRSDVHPANSWSHCVEMYPTCSSLFDYLGQQNLSREDVLWIRLSKEDADFDYEKLSSYTYHNCNSSEGPETVDKYIKGQEFPVVVIEGFSEPINEWAACDDKSIITDAEREMWKLRRMLYVCCSRANAFLYFVVNTTETPAVKSMKSEVERIVNSLAQPIDPFVNHGTIWAFTVKWGAQCRRFIEVVDLGESLSASYEVDGKKCLELQEPIVVKNLATALGLKPFKIIKDLIAMQIFANINQTLNKDIAEKICELHGFDLLVSPDPQ